MAIVFNSLKCLQNKDMKLRNSIFLCILITISSANLFAELIETPLDKVQELRTSDSNTTRIYLVRHGESAFNVADANGIKYTSGKGLDIPLSDKGEIQATALGKKLNILFPKEASIEVVSSTAKRAHDTAELILEQLVRQKVSRAKEDYDGFTEMGQGDWEGKPKDEKFDNEVRNWNKLSAKDKYTHPKLSTGESYSEVADRYLASLQDVVNAYPNKTIIIVSHHAAMNALNLKLSGAVDDLSKEPGSSLPTIPLENGDILLLELPVDKKVDQAKVKKIFKSKV